MKTVVVLIEKRFVCPVAVSVPDRWDVATTKQRLMTPAALHALDCMADTHAWEESMDLPAIWSINAPAGHVEPVISFGEDDPMPAHPDQLGPLA